MEPADSPVVDAPAAVDAPVAAAADTDSTKAAPVAPAAEVTATVAVADKAEAHGYRSLYDGPWTSILAIVLGAGIVLAIQMGVRRLFSGAKSESSALTAFATSMCAIIVAVWACDMIVGGPNVELLSEQERITTLGFIKDMTMLVFAYYFGTQSAKKGAE